MLPEKPKRLSSWRDVYEEQTQSPHWDEFSATDELLEAHLRRLESQVFQTLQARERFYFQLKAYVEQEGRTPDHQTLVEE
jgi:hypothetical protein